MKRELEVADLFIDGESVPAESGERFEVIDPATEEVCAEVAAGAKADVDRAIEAAHEAIPEWRDTDPVERGRLIHDLVDALRDHEEELAQLETKDNGKPISQSRGGVRSTAKYFEYYAGVADKIRGDSVPVSRDYVDFTVKEPLGVTGHIIPWNFPMNIFGRTVAPALVAGNTVVVKPAEQTPRTALEIAKIADEVGFPDGVINVVPGLGHQAGAALSGHPDVDGISFTGSVDTGREVAKAAVDNVNPVHLELGGKSPNVVFPDADLEDAAATTAGAIFEANCGQVCSAASRLVVHEDVHDEVVERIADRAEELVLGPGHEDPDLGPLVSEAQHERVKRYVELGREEAGEPIVGGEAPDREGYFFEPTIFDEVDRDARITQEEIFGPVLVVQTFSEEAEAIELANGVEYGLVAGVFTSDVGRAHRVARDIEAGNVYINDWFAGGKGAPFGGYKKSGFGREKGLEAIDSFTQVKNIIANVGE